MTTQRHQCDRCSARAVHRFTHGSDPNIELMFCGHHATAFLVQLGKQGFVAVEASEEELVHA